MGIFLKVLNMTVLGETQIQQERNIIADQVEEVILHFTTLRGPILEFTISTDSVKVSYFFLPIFIHKI